MCVRERERVYVSMGVCVCVIVEAFGFRCHGLGRRFGVNRCGIRVYSRFDRVYRIGFMVGFICPAQGPGFTHPGAWWRRSASGVMI